MTTKKKTNNLLDKLAEAQAKMEEVRSQTDIGQINLLINATIVCLVIAMIIFGWAYPNFTILKVLFIIGLFILVALIVTKKTWFPKEFDKEAEAYNKNNSGETYQILPPSDQVIGENQKII